MLRNFLVPLVFLCLASGQNVCLKNNCDVLEKLSKVYSNADAGNEELKQLIINQISALDSSTLNEVKNLLRVLVDDTEKDHEKFEDSMDELLRTLRAQSGSGSNKLVTDIRARGEEILGKIDQLDENIDRLETSSGITIQKLKQDILAELDSHVDEVQDNFNKKIASLESLMEQVLDILRLPARPAPEYEELFGTEPSFHEPKPTPFTPTTFQPEEDEDEGLSNIDRLSTLLQSPTTTATPIPTTTEVPKINDCSELPTFQGIATLKSGTRVKCYQGWTSLLDVTVPDTLSFDRKWAEYIAGFANDKGGFWFGLKNLADLLTSTEKKYQLKYTFEATETMKNSEVVPIEPVLISGTYDNFKVDARNEYQISLGTYTGNPKFDIFNCQKKSKSRIAQSMKFSTVDHGSVTGVECARANKAGFWWNNCGLFKFQDYSMKRVGQLETCDSELKIYFLSSVALDIRPVN